MSVSDQVFDEDGLRIMTYGLFYVSFVGMGIWTVFSAQSAVISLAIYAGVEYNITRYLALSEECFEMMHTSMGEERGVSGELRENHKDVRMSGKEQVDAGVVHQELGGGTTPRVGQG